jgi:hypothetical protein
MARVKDTVTLDLFEIPTVDIVIPGESFYAREVSETVSLLMAESGIKDRYMLSAEVSRLADKDVSKHMLDAYCSPARLDHSLPFWLAPILETVCSGHHLTNWLVAKRGGRVAYGADALDAEIGKLELMKEEMLKEMNSRLKDLKRLKSNAGNE